jgi:hypothetical protein
MSQITYPDVAGFQPFFPHKCFETYSKSPDGFEDGVLAGRVRPDVFLRNVLSVLHFAEIKKIPVVRPAVKDALSDILKFLQDPHNHLLKLQIEFKVNPFLASIGSVDLAEKVELVSVSKHTRVAVAKKVQEVTLQEVVPAKMTKQDARKALSSAFSLDVMNRFDQSMRTHTKLLGNKPLSFFKIVLDAIYPYLAETLEKASSYEQIHRKLSLIWHEDHVNDPEQKAVLGIYFRLFEFVLSNMKEEDKNARITSAEFKKIATRQLRYEAVDLKEALAFFEASKNFSLQTRRFELVGLHVRNIDDYIDQNILTEDQFYAFFGLFQPAPAQPDVASENMRESFNSLIETADSLEVLRKNAIYAYAYRKVWDTALLKFIASPEMRSKVTFVTFLYCAKAIEVALQAEESIRPKKFEIKLDLWAVATALYQKFNDYSKKSHKENRAGFSVAEREPLPIKKPPTLPPRPQAAKKMPA